MPRLAAPLPDSLTVAPGYALNHQASVRSIRSTGSTESEILNRNFDLVSISPTGVIGPLIGKNPSEAVQPFLDMMKGNGRVDGHVYVLLSFFFLPSYPLILGGRFDSGEYRHSFQSR